MVGRRTNLALLLLLVVALATGILGFTIGTQWGRWVAVAHGVAGVGIVLLAPWKSMIVRRGWRRHRVGPTRLTSVLLSAAVVVTVASGLLQSTGLVLRAGPFNTMQLHVGAALVSIPLAIAHVATRPVRPRRLDWDRRNLLRVAGLAGAAVVTYGAVEGAMRLASLPGRQRRFTGSHERGSFRPTAMPVTQWLDDRVQRIDPKTWTLTVQGSASSRAWTTDELAAFNDTLTATLDCTSGWYSEQEWTGVRLERLVAEHDGHSILVRSATGFSRRLPRESASNLLLAIAVGGKPLSAGHGAPARLVAPGRRGFWWVKWVEEISVEARPWWVQLPFPIT